MKNDNGSKVNLNFIEDRISCDSAEHLEIVRKP